MAASQDAWHVQVCKCVVMHCTVLFCSVAIVALLATIMCALRMYYHVFVMYSNVLMCTKGCRWSVLHDVEWCALLTKPGT
jgi:hypothetical protein